MDGAEKSNKRHPCEKWLFDLAPAANLPDGEGADADEDEAETVKKQAEAVHKLVEKWYRFWSDWHPTSPAENHVRMLQLFRCDEQYDGQVASKVRDLWLSYFGDIRSLMKHYNLHRGDDDATKQRLDWYECTQATINNVYHVVIRSVDICARPNRHAVLSFLDSKDRILDPQPIVDLSTMTKKAFLIELLLQHAEVRGYVRLADEIYEPVYHRHHFLHAYKQVSSYKDFISKCKYEAQQSNHEVYEKFLAVPEPFLQSEIADRTPEARILPVVQPDRHWFAFDNGFYNAITDVFFPLGDAKTRLLPRKLVVANYFPGITFKYAEYDRIRREARKKHPEKGGEPWFHPKTNPDYQPWFMNIPTPKCDTIINAQKWPKEVVWVLWALVGRTLRHLGEEDRWHVAPVFEGTSGCGKSTFARMIYENYAFRDVGILANDMQKQFGLEHLCKKFILAALDLKSDFGLPEMMFNCMIANEAVSVARKFKVAIDLLWDVPIVFACTEFPSWLHGAQRRLQVFGCNNSVEKAAVNDELLGEMRLERAEFMVKCNNAYRWLRDAIRAAKTNYYNFIRRLTPYFAENQKQRLRIQNMAYRFLYEMKEQKLLDYGTEEAKKYYYIESTALQKEFGTFLFKQNCRDPKVRARPLHDVNYEEARQLCGITCTMTERRRSPITGEISYASWFVGVTLTQYKAKLLDYARQPAVGT